VRIWARPRAGRGACPCCGAGSARVHSRYERRLADAAVAGRRVEIQLRVRRFFCENTRCSARTFAEQIAGLTARHARRSPVLQRMLESIGLAVAGRAGARLAGALGIAGEPQHAAAVDPRAAGPGDRHRDGARGGRFRAAPRARLRHRARRHPHPSADRPAPRPAGRHVRRVAARASRRRGDLSRPRRRLRRRREYRRTRCDPGRRPLAPMAQPCRARGEDRRRAPRLPAPPRRHPACDPRRAGQRRRPRGGGPDRADRTSGELRPLWSRAPNNVTRPFTP
jgi:hypothetical protein